VNSGGKPENKAGQARVRGNTNASAASSWARSLAQKVSLPIGVAIRGKKRENKESEEYMSAGMGKTTTQWGCHIGTASGPEVRNLIN
jgi:hypothetical protein